jgi:hypothetical protein
MNGQLRPFGEPFVTGGFAQLRFPGDPMGPPHEVINCRCMITRRLGETNVDAYTDAANDPRGKSGLMSEGEYLDLANSSRPGGVDDGVATLPRGFGRAPGDMVTSPINVRSQTPFAESLSQEQLQRLTETYRRQQATILDRDLTGYINVLKSDLPGGKVGNMAGKTFNLPKIEGISLNSANVASQGGGKTLLRINMRAGQNVLFTGADDLSFALPPGTKLVAKSARYISADDFLGDTGGILRLGQRLLKPGKLGYLIVDVDIVPNSSLLAEYLSAFETVLAARPAAQIVSVSELEAVIERNHSAAALSSEGNPVKLRPKKAISFGILIQASLLMAAIRLCAGPLIRRMRPNSPLIRKTRIMIGVYGRSRLRPAIRSIWIWRYSAMNMAIISTMSRPRRNMECVHPITQRLSGKRISAGMRQLRPRMKPLDHFRVWPMSCRSALAFRNRNCWRAVIRALFPNICARW